MRNWRSLLQLQWEIPLVETKERKDHGLCCNYNEKFHLGHCCKSQKLFCTKGVWPDSEEIQEELNEAEKREGTPDEVLQEISIHEMAKASNPQTMSVIGQLQNQPITILMDSRKAHNFVGPTTIGGDGFRAFKGSSIQSHGHQWRSLVR